MNISFTPETSHKPQSKTAPSSTLTESPVPSESQLFFHLLTKPRPLHCPSLALPENDKSDVNSADRESRTF